MFLRTQLGLAAELMCPKFRPYAGVCPETKKNQKTCRRPHPERRIKPLRMPRPGSPREDRNDCRPDRQQQPKWRTVHFAPEIGKRVDSKPEQRNAAVEHTHHPWDVQQLCLHIWIVAVIRMDIAVSGSGSANN